MRLHKDMDKFEFVQVAKKAAAKCFSFYGLAMYVNSRFISRHPSDIDVA